MIDFVPLACLAAIVLGVVLMYANVLRTLAKQRKAFDEHQAFSAERHGRLALVVRKLEHEVDVAYRFLNLDARISRGKQEGYQNICDEPPLSSRLSYPATTKKSKMPITPETEGVAYDRATLEDSAWPPDCRVSLMHVLEETWIYLITQGQRPESLRVSLAPRPRPYVDAQLLASAVALASGGGPSSPLDASGRSPPGPWEDGRE